MNPIRHIRRFAAVLALPAAAVLLATPAFARMVPNPADAYPGHVAPALPAQIQYRTIVAGGMPGWQIALIAVGAALLTATVAVLADRARAAAADRSRGCLSHARRSRGAAWPVAPGGTAAGRARRKVSTASGHAAPANHATGPA